MSKAYKLSLFVGFDDCEKIDEKIVTQDEAIKLCALYCYNHASVDSTFFESLQVNEKRTVYSGFSLYDIKRIS